MKSKSLVLVKQSPPHLSIGEGFKDTEGDRVNEEEHVGDSMCSSHDGDSSTEPSDSCATVLVSEDGDVSDRNVTPMQMSPGDQDVADSVEQQT